MNLDNMVLWFVSVLAQLVRLRVERADNLNQGFCGPVWNANETGEFTRVMVDYNPDDKRKESGLFCPSCVYCDPNGYYANDTLMTYLEACDAGGETGSVTLASRRLRRARKVNAFNVMQANRDLLAERKCDEAVSKRTARAASYLKRDRLLIQAEGRDEQQEIFETQMMRMGEHDTQVEDWRDDFETWPTFNEQIRSMPRFNRHQRTW